MSFKDQPEGRPLNVVLARPKDSPDFLKQAFPWQLFHIEIIAE